MPTIQNESTTPHSPTRNESPAQLREHSVSPIANSAASLAQLLSSGATPQLHSPGTPKTQEQNDWLDACDSDIDDSDDETVPEEIRVINFANTQTQGSNLVAESANGGDFHSLLEKLGALRHSLANNNREDHAENFGAPRNDLDKIGKRGHWETTIVRENYPQHLSAIAAFLNNKNIQLTDGWNDENKIYTHQMSTSKGKHIPATTIHVQTANLEKPEIECKLEHTPCAHLPVLNEEASTLFNETVEHANNGNTPEAISSLAKFVYVFAHAMPLKRGSAMVGEMFTHGLLQKTGQTTEFKQLKGLDFLAFTNTQDAFEAAFRAKLGL